MASGRRRHALEGKGRMSRTCLIEEIALAEGFDVVVNNAGAITKLALEDEDDNLTAWYDTLQVNLHAPRLISHLAVPRL